MRKKRVLPDAVHADLFPMTLCITFVFVLFHESEIREALQLFKRYGVKVILFFAECRLSMSCQLTKQIIEIAYELGMMASGELKKTIHFMSISLKSHVNS